MPYKDQEKRRARHREYMRRRYAENDEHRALQKARCAKNNAKLREANRTAVLAAKSGGCVVCTEDDAAALDLHHVDPASKLFSLGSASHRSTAAVLDEIAKCVALCANCHRKLHAGVLDLPSRCGQVTKAAS